MNIKIRLGSSIDIPFVQKLAIDVAEHSVPPTRTTPHEQISENISKTMSILDQALSINPKLRLLIAETENDEPVGYLILFLNNIEETTGEPQAFIVDLAVSKKYWGKFVWRHLTRKAEEIARSEGLSYIAGSVSVNNIRSLKMAQKFLGYQIERYQVAKKLT